MHRICRSLPYFNVSFEGWKIKGKEKKRRRDNYSKKYWHVSTIHTTDKPQSVHTTLVRETTSRKSALEGVLRIVAARCNAFEELFLLNAVMAVGISSTKLHFSFRQGNIFQLQRKRSSPPLHYAVRNWPRFSIIRGESNWMDFTFWKQEDGSSFHCWD